jgi:hypothetical protein
MTIKTLEQTQTSSQFSPISETQLPLQHRTRPDSHITAEVQRVLQGDTILSATADRINPDASSKSSEIHLLLVQSQTNLGRAQAV